MHTDEWNQLEKYFVILSEYFTIKEKYNLQESFWKSKQYELRGRLIWCKKVQCINVISDRPYIDVNNQYLVYCYEFTDQSKNNVQLVSIERFHNGHYMDLDIECVRWILAS